MMNKSIFMAGCLNTSPHHQTTNGKVIQFRYNRQGEALALQVKKVRREYFDKAICGFFPYFV